MLEISLAIAVKTLSNCSNHLLHTPIDDMFAGRAWKRCLERIPAQVVPQRSGVAWRCPSCLRHRGSLTHVRALS